MNYYVSNDGTPMKNGQATIKGLDRVIGEIQNKTRKMAFIGDPITVYLKSGIYHIDKPIFFNMTNTESIITFKAFEDEKPVICGGKKIEDWEEAHINGINAWRTYIDDVKESNWYFYQLFVNSERQKRSRYPKTKAFISEEKKHDKYEMFESVHNFKYQDNIDEFKTNENMEVIFDHYWIHDRASFSNIDFKNKEINTDKKYKMAMKIWSEDDFYFDNVFCKMTEPGEWYLDKKSGYLYYIPKEGEKINETEIYAPVADKFIEIKGEPENNKYIEYLSFEGIEFRYCKSAGIKNSNQAASNLDGSITLNGAKNCRFKNCVFDGVGQYCIDVQEGCNLIEISDCTLKNMGGGGIRVNGSNDFNKKELHTYNICIKNNEIVRGGRIYCDAIGVLLMNAYRNMVSHNHIFDFYYSGLSCGYVWGYGDNISRENIIEYNHIHKIGQGVLSDLGAMYYLGVQPGTKIRNNIVHDVTVKHYGGSGIYLDEGASNIVVENNIVFDTRAPSFVLHYGRDNIVRNNIFIAGKEGGIQIAKREELNDSNTALNIYSNIIVTDGQPPFTAGHACDIKDDEMRSNSNVIWNRSDKELMVYDNFSQPFGVRGPMSFDIWQSIGNDSSSVFEDPGFKDIENRDFTLKKDSCAYRVGFKDIK